MKNGERSADKQWRITVRVELGDSEKVLSESEFDTIVSEAIRRILGHAAPTYTLGPYDRNSRKGSIVVSASDSNLVWAALSIYGRHFGAPIALHLNSLTIIESC
uniref:Ribonuclease P n=1 Tax=Parascaris univalens TaxID=6257 RepID=A0A915BFR0_PARUN